MTTEKRLELQKRLMNESEERLSYKVCRIIAKDLNLSVQQVCVSSHLDYSVGDFFLSFYLSSIFNFVLSIWFLFNITDWMDLFC
jgi:hypothetical protein